MDVICGTKLNVLFNRRSWPSSSGDQHQLFRDLWVYVTRICCVLATVIQMQQSLVDGRYHSKWQSSFQNTQTSSTGYLHCRVTFWVISIFQVGSLGADCSWLGTCWHGTRLVSAARSDPGSGCWALGTQTAACAPLHTAFVCRPALS